MEINIMFIGVGTVLALMLWRRYVIAKRDGDMQDVFQVKMIAVAVIIIVGCIFLLYLLHNHFYSI